MYSQLKDQLSLTLKLVLKYFDSMMQGSNGQRIKSVKLKITEEVLNLTITFFFSMLNWILKLFLQSFSQGRVLSNSRELN